MLYTLSSQTVMYAHHFNSYLDLKGANLIRYETSDLKSKQNPLQ